MADPVSFAGKVDGERLRGGPRAVVRVCDAACVAFATHVSDLSRWRVLE